MSSDNLSYFLEYMRQGEIKRMIHRFFDELNKKKAKSIAVVSLKPGEGRTFLVAVLAVAAAIFMKKKVLVVDTTSQPDQGHLYLERIFGQASLEKYVDLISPQYSSNGNDDVADFKLKELIDLYQNKYDLVIFDTTAIQSDNSSGMDPVIVAKTAGHAVIAISGQSVTSGDFKQLQGQMRDWGISPLGTIYNFGSAK